MTPYSEPDYLQDYEPESEDLDFGFRQYGVIVSIDNTTLFSETESSLENPLVLDKTGNILKFTLNESDGSSITQNDVKLQADILGNLLGIAVTCDNLYANDRVGIATTNPTSTLHVIGNTLTTGIATVGLGTTSSPPSNSQMSFELTSDTNLRIKVRGTDGHLRSANITLA